MCCTVHKSWSSHFKGCRGTPWNCVRSPNGTQSHNAFIRLKIYNSSFMGPFYLFLIFFENCWAVRRKVEKLRSIKANTGYLISIFKNIVESEGCTPFRSDSVFIIILALIITKVRFLITALSNIRSDRSCKINKCSTRH